MCRIRSTADAQNVTKQGGGGRRRTPPRALHLLSEKLFGSCVKRIWYIQDSRGQLMAVIFRCKSFKPCTLLRFRCEALLYPAAVVASAWVRTPTPLGPYSRTMPRALWWSLAGGTQLRQSPDCLNSIFKRVKSWHSDRGDSWLCDPVSNSSQSLF